MSSDVVLITDDFQFELPAAPVEDTHAVKAWPAPVTMPTYMPDAPERCPMFLDRRVYQGSSGRVYPLPVVDRIAGESTLRDWQAIHIENQYLRVMILPEIGGRIHVGYDKVSGYDFFYRQNVIKPALVGLAGPWVSGGVEFNWPQHHRPATFMPVATEIERHDDGSVTVWCSDHDPMQRMKGMHGVCLHPDRHVVELKVRLFNRTPYTQTFLWWANVATRVHEQYQSFFPTDVRFVADHAKRAVTSYPLSDGSYYGIDYGERAKEGVPAANAPAHFRPDGSYAPNDLGWYANIPVPTSYMIVGTKEDFFGGYDHKADAGVVHVANHHISPGKKQWTWGNHEFGYAWDRNLTDHDGPYIELMAGVYTDNQPDFSYLAPWETKTFVQTWYPIQKIGVPQAANIDAALSLKVIDGAAQVGLYVTSDQGEIDILLKHEGHDLQRWHLPATVAAPLLLAHALPAGSSIEEFSVSVLASSGLELIGYDPASVVPAESPVVAQEPGAPDRIESLEELYLTGVHLAQYRHATRWPELYWREALRRDPLDSRCNTAMSGWHLHRGEIEQAVSFAEKALCRVTKLNPNPRNGEPSYALGLARRAQGEDQKAYDAFYKATWDAAWRGPAYMALAEFDMKRQHWSTALDHLHRSLSAEADNLLARMWRVVCLRKLSRETQAMSELASGAALDPLDIGMRWLQGIDPEDSQQRLDLAFDLRRAGLYRETTKLLMNTDNGSEPSTALIELLLKAELAETEGAFEQAGLLWKQVDTTCSDYCFPNRLDEYLLLTCITKQQPSLARPYALLGNFLYDRRRLEEAIESWETALSRGLEDAVIHRNLGIAYFNVRGDGAKARSTFAEASRLAPTDARILFEKDQLAKRTGVPSQGRFTALTHHQHLVEARDDLSVEMATLLNQTGRPAEALQLLLSRNFQPWEGGEGRVLGQYVRAHLLLAQASLEAGDGVTARQHVEAALQPPSNLSEARHLLANQSDIFYWLGMAESALGNRQAAQASWERAVAQKGDFRDMSVRTISDMTYWTALSMLRLDRTEEAKALLIEVIAYADSLESTVPKIDYFATSLPTMLLFEDDLKQRARIDAAFLRAQAFVALGELHTAEEFLNKVTALDSSHTGAADLGRQLHSMRQVVS